MLSQCSQRGHCFVFDLIVVHTSFPAFSLRFHNSIGFACEIPDDQDNIFERATEISETNGFSVTCIC